jgi:plasmid stabilization system protein ParE
MMRVQFLTLASEEVAEAHRYYDLQQAGLGRQFVTEVRHATRRIAQFPLAFPFQRGEIRKCLLHRFPYKLLYAIRSDSILIIALAHQHREPEYWVDRTDLKRANQAAV